MAGDWTIQQTMKPSVWFPDGKTEVTQHTAWGVGGRFLVFRGYDQQKQMLSLALMTCDPRDKSYRFRYFANDAYGGQWRVTWNGTAGPFTER